MMKSNAATIRIPSADEPNGVWQDSPNTYSALEILDLAVMIQQTVMEELLDNDRTILSSKKPGQPASTRTDDLEEAPWQAIVNHSVFQAFVRIQFDTTISLQEVLQALLTSIESSSSTDSVRRETFTLRSTLHQAIQVLSKSLLCQEQLASRVQETMYSFAYGLSHEINNPLANIVGRAQQLLTASTKASEKKSLTTIVDSASRAHEMLAEMMLSIQRPPLKLQVQDIRRLFIDKATVWKERFEQHHIEFDAVIDDESLWCSANIHALDESISCALRNSLDACQGGSRVSLVAQRIEDENAKLQVRIAVIDNGPGLAKAELELAWDVYYSGREAGRGLGVGLSKVKRIVDSHSGHVWIESDSNRGFALEIRLPWQRPQRRQ